MDGRQGCNVGRGEVPLTIYQLVTQLHYNLYSPIVLSFKMVEVRTAGSRASLGIVYMNVKSTIGLAFLDFKGTPTHPQKWIWWTQKGNSRGKKFKMTF